MSWFELNTPERVISPSLLFYKDRVVSNINSMVRLAGDPARLIPHVKTHKCPDIVRIQLEAGISKFKCATIAEAEMVAEAGAKWILISYQLVGPNIDRLFKLKETYPYVNFASLVDNEVSANGLNQAALDRGLKTAVFIDINNGMNRSGHPVDESLFALYKYVAALTHMTFGGLHVYDGHIRNPEFSERKAVADSAFEQVLPLIDVVRNDLGSEPMVIAGGSPSFTVHVLRPNVFLSPGTNVLWDWGYGDRFDGQPFEHAAVILTRVVSKPSQGIVTIDLGHKAISAENPIETRIRILNLHGYTVLSQSEEHGVLQVTAEVWNNTSIGDVLYVVPFHVCPTVALHDFASIVQNGDVVDEWKITARSRRLTI